MKIYVLEVSENCWDGEWRVYGVFTDIEQASAYGNSLMESDSAVEDFLINEFELDEHAHPM
jgi:hypothetical protein